MRRRGGEGFPRLYLDADVMLAGSAARVVLERLRSGALAARPPIRYETSGASAPVRSYYRARSRVPAVLGSLWGAASTGSPRPAGAGSALSRTWWRTTSGWTGCSPRTRWRSSIARRSWLRCRVAVAIFYGCSAVSIGGKRETAFAPDLHDRAPETIGSTLRDLGRAGLAGPAAALDAATYAAFAAGARLALALPTGRYPACR